jgi:hypothetical protein
MNNKKEAAKSNKVTVLPIENEADNVLTNALSAAMSKAPSNIDEAIKKAKEANKKVNTEPTYFPNEDTASGELIEGILLGFTMVPSKKDNQEPYKAALLAGEGKEMIIVSSKKAVDRLEKMVPIGKLASITYVGEKTSSTTGNKFHDVRVGYYE